MKELNKYTKETLIGLILGDAHIGKSKDKYFITLEQTTKHEKYVLYIYDMLKKQGIDLHDIKYYTRVDKRHSSINKSIYFKTHSSDQFNELGAMFLENSKKIIPLNIKEWLTPVSLAHWICGDGQLVKDGGITLCTDSYTKQEVDILLDALVFNFNAKCSIHNKKVRNGNVYNRIYIHKNSFNQIKPLITEHLYESFFYKLHM